MKIGIAAPVSIELLDFDYKKYNIPKTYTFPLISYIVNGLLKNGYEVIIYTLSNEINQSLVIKENNLTICIGQRDKHAGRNFFKKTRDNLIELIKKNPSDLINAQWSYEYAWASVCSGIPTIVTVRDDATTILKYIFDPFRIVKWIINYIVLSKAQHLTTNSNYLLELLSPKNRKKAIVINNFYSRNLEKYYSEFKQDSKFIVSVGNGFNNRKNIKNALLAFAIVKQKYKDYKYILIGDDMESNGKAYLFAKEHSLLEGVEFLGKRSFKEAIEFIHRAEVFIHPSREESFGNVILESMVVGTPVIGGINSGNVPFLINDGETGILCNVDSPKEIAKAICKILEDKDLAQHIRNEAYLYAKSYFNEDIIIKKYIEHYRKVFNLYY